MMANYQTPMNNYFRPNSLNVDSQKYYDEENDGVLDENILDSSIDMSPPTTDGSRRDSYAVFSPKPQQDWTSAEMQPSLSNNPFVDQNTSSYIPNQHVVAFAHQNQWRPENISIPQASLQYDGFPTEFESTNFRPIQRQTPFSNNGNHVSLFSPSTATNPSMPGSPQRDWSSSEQPEHRMAKRMRHNSPALRSHSPLLRRDGIRKKNARFDIPAERTLTNIDRLISESVDDQEIKELKQQKRLLRNRQAALDSRQRKKQHTERLEDEKKHFTTVVQDLERDLMESQQREDELRYQLQEYQEHCRQVQLDQEDMMHSHTQETAMLRKKISVLTETVVRLESTPTPTVPGSAGFALSEFDSLTMDTWDFFGQDGEVKGDTPVVAASKSLESSTIISDSEKSPAQGILLMILLFGAFVASRGSAPGVPRMSDDVRAASATLLEDVFKDAGITPSTNTKLAPTSTQSMTANINSNGNNNNQIWPASTALHVHPNDLTMFGTFTDSLLLPTEEQKNEQLFGITPSQYNGVSSPTFLNNMPDSNMTPVSQGRKNIAEALAAMRSKEKDKSAAEVYTRSLLWNQIPQDVVRNFAKLVEEQSTNFMK